MSTNLGTICGAWSFPRVAVLKLIFIYTGDWCLRESLQFPKEVKPLVLYDVEHGIVMESMKGKWATS